MKTIIPTNKGMICVGVTCGYLIFFGTRIPDFWLVNPFTRKELHFPGFRYCTNIFPKDISGILVFSPSMSGWVFVVLLHKFCIDISFSLASKPGRWRYISTLSYNHDVHFFMGKIYLINTRNEIWELRLGPQPTLTLQKLKNSPLVRFKNLEFVSSGENLYVMEKYGDSFEAIEVDFDEMKWVYSERTIGEYAFFLSELKCGAAIKPDTWARPWTQYKRINYTDSGGLSRNGTCLTTKMWYFPHDCLNDNNSDMENGALWNILKY